MDKVGEVGGGSASQPPLYFNDNDPYPAQWLRNLWPTGYVDERSITDLQDGDFEGYSRVHLFAGIGGWELALNMAGWPSDMPVWTGSCPCQPFSTAGKRQGDKDARHLWPEMRRLIAECHPPVVFGEQVASKAGRAWLTGVRADLETLGYGVGAADLCAAGLGAPHIRQRLWWVAYSTDLRRTGRGDAPPTEVQGYSTQRTGEYPQPGQAGELQGGLEGHSGTGGVANTQHPQRWPQLQKHSDTQGRDGLGGGGDTGGLGNTDHSRPQGRLIGGHSPGEWATGSSGMGPWADYNLIPCADGKQRRIEPGSFPLAYGIPSRVGQLRAYGNSIVPAVAATFITAFMEAVA